MFRVARSTPQPYRLSRSEYDATIGYFFRPLRFLPFFLFFLAGLAVCGCPVGA